MFTTPMYEWQKQIVYPYTAFLVLCIVLAMVKSRQDKDGKKTKSKSS